MTDEDRKEFRALLREEIGAAERRTQEEIGAAERRMHESIGAAERRITEATTANLSELRHELREEIQASASELRRELREEIQANRIELSDQIRAISTRMDTAMTAIEHVGNFMTAITSHLDRAQRDRAETNTNLHALERDVRDLRARVEALEKRAS